RLLEMSRTALRPDATAPEWARRAKAICGRKGESMTHGERRGRWRRIVVAGAVAALAWSAAYAKDRTGYVKEAERYIAQGDLKAAEIQLRNAIREAPQDPVLRARLAEVYLRLGNATSAEREARAARE